MGENPAVGGFLQGGPRSASPSTPASCASSRRAARAGRSRPDSWTRSSPRASRCPRAYGRPTRGVRGGRAADGDDRRADADPLGRRGHLLPARRAGRRSCPRSQGRGSSPTTAPRTPRTGRSPSALQPRSPPSPRARSAGRPPRPERGGRAARRARRPPATVPSPHARPANPAPHQRRARRARLSTQGDDGGVGGRRPRRPRARPPAERPGPVPKVLETDHGEVLVDSMRIVAWLENLRPAPPLWPADPRRRAEVDVFLEWFDRVWKVPPNAIEAELCAPEPNHARIAELGGADARLARVVRGPARRTRPPDGRGASASPTSRRPVPQVRRHPPGRRRRAVPPILIEHLPVAGRLRRLEAWIARVERTAAGLEEIPWRAFREA